MKTLLNKKCLLKVKQIAREATNDKESLLVAGIGALKDPIQRTDTVFTS